MAEQLPVLFEFNANQTFAGFFPGGNQEIYNHLRHTVSGKGERYLLLWGEAGLGKTHLLQACCDEAYQLGLSVFYFDCAGNTMLTSELFDGLEMYELLCLDNIQAVCGHLDLETALFNFFNRQREQQHRLIVSANRNPKLLDFRLPDLQTRLNWGLSLKLKVLSDEDTIHALSFKAQRLGLEMPLQSAKFLLTHYDRSLSVLWPALDQLDNASLANKRKLTIPFLKEVLKLEK
jgi:DnaA-homolog protein